MNSRIRSASLVMTLLAASVPTYLAARSETSTFGPAKVLCQAMDSCTILLHGPGPSPEPVAHQFNPGLLPDGERETLLQDCLNKPCTAVLVGTIPDPIAGDIKVVHGSAVR